MESIVGSNKKTKTAGIIPSHNPAFSIPTSPQIPTSSQRHQTPHWKI